MLSGGGNVTNSEASPRHPARVQMVENRPLNTTTWQPTGVVSTGLGSSNAVTVTAYALCTT